jgi:hypothetical protein
MAFNIKEQDGLRESLESYIKETGVKVRFLSKKVNICETIICHFRKGRMQLPDHQFNSLLNYLIGKK